MVKVNWKYMISGSNLLFVGGAIVISIVILNLYSKLVQSIIPGWIALMIVIVSTVFGIFISGWLLRLRKKDMTHIEFYITVAAIIVIMLSLQQYAPNLLYGADVFIEPSREVLADVSRSVFVK